MNDIELKELIGKGETSTVQFKGNITNERSIAQEMVAFANSRGGTILIGVDDKTWDITGLDDDSLRRLTDLVVNAANEHMKSPLFIETETVIADGKKIMVVQVPEGNNKPYKDKDGLIFLKNGANKRKVTTNEELLRLLSRGKNLFADELPVPQVGIGDLNREDFDKYFLREFKIEYEKLGLSFEEALKAKRVLLDNHITLASEVALQELLENSLPNSLTVEALRYGNPVVRNNLMVSFALHTLPYRGLGSGIKRALEEQPDIEFINDTEGEQFKVIIPRPERQ